MLLFGGLDLLGQVPGDRLALAIGVGREVDDVDRFADFLISAMIFPLPRMTTYSGSKPCSTSTPIFDFGRSMTWPTDAFTVKPAPRYFLMVLALAGDSTTTSAVSRVALAGFSLSLSAAALGCFFGRLWSLLAAFFFVLWRAWSFTSTEDNARRRRAQPGHRAPDPPPSPRRSRPPDRRG